MERFMWSFDGEKFSEGVEPIRFERNERARVVLINNTMMTHPIHLHGHFFEVVNGHTGSYPRKHTVNVLPGGKVSFDLTADAPGDWAFHSPLLPHMRAGMFRVVPVRPLVGAAACSLSWASSSRRSPRPRSEARPGWAGGRHPRSSRLR